MTVLDPTAVPLIDREFELHRLASVADHVRGAMSGRLLVVVGPRGVGKTRIVDAFGQWCSSQSMTVVVGQCISHAAEPLLPIRDALRPRLGTSQRTVRSVLRRTAPDLLEGVPIIGKFLAGLGHEMSGGLAIGGDNPRSLYDVLASLVISMGGRGGVCLVVEDAHLADPDTLSFLTYLANKSRNHTTLTMVTVPAEEQRSLPIAEYLLEWEERGSETLRVGPFERASVSDYLAAVLPGDGVDESTLDFMVTYTGGNPLLLSESVRLVDQDRSPTKLTSPAAEVPDRIRQLLERRLRRLDDRTRSFVDIAAVVAETSHELAPILHLLGSDERSGLADLERACDAGLLAENADGEISFTSELFHMVAKAQLRPNQRRSLHEAAGTWFESRHQFSEAAHHYERCQDLTRLLPAALRAAEAAEGNGLYAAAVSWYRRVQALADPADLFPRLAKALMVVGEWADADRLLNALPSDDPQTLLLRSRLCFVRGDVTGAAHHANLALGRGAAEDVDVLVHLANIHLYAGNFAPASDYAERALQAARTAGSINDQARCLITRGACLLYDGDPPAAEQSFQDGVWLLDALSPDRRDGGVYSALLGNRGFVEEVGQRWSEAEGSHREALRLRRELADVVGVLEETLAIGRTALGRGDLAAARERLTEALRLAEDLGEELQQAKVIHALGELAARAGDTDGARRMVEDARHRFVRCGTTYDVAYADLSLATILAATDPRESIERLAEARSAVEQKGFRLLQRLFPQLELPLEARIQAGLVAYAAGDAFGLPWEGQPPEGIRMQDLDELPATELWSSGSTSDDTALTLLVTEHLVQSGGLGAPMELLDRLASQSDTIRGLGPSTKRAIEHFKTTGTADDSGSNTNGAPMRALPIGWALPVSAVEQRRDWAMALSRVTHTGQDALTAACAIAACASWAVEGAPPSVLVDVAVEEAAAVGADTQVAATLHAVRDGRWEAPPDGITLAPDETVGAVLHCCTTTDGDLANGLRLAVSLGGDTDTVAALVGGLLGCRLAPADVATRLSWLDRVTMPCSDADLAQLASGLASIRLALGE